MRVIAGKYRTKRLKTPVGDRVRPTPDRIKETVFNILYSMGKPMDCKVLDLFCGTGGLGIEALSRGAVECVFVDIDKKSVALTRENLAIIGEKAKVYHAEYKSAIPKLEGRKFDVILLDPPFNMFKEGEVVALIKQHDILEKNGVIMIEHSKENKLAGLSEEWDRDTRSCGNTNLTFLSRGGH